MTTNLFLPRGNTFAVGADIVIYCNVTGYPRPDVIWYRNGQEIIESSRQRISGISNQRNKIEFKFKCKRNIILGHSTLTIYGADASDAGSYKCEARNQFTSSFHEEPINVEGKQKHILIFVTH